MRVPWAGLAGRQSATERWRPGVRVQAVFFARGRSTAAAHAERAAQPALVLVLAAPPSAVSSHVRPSIQRCLLALWRTWRPQAAEAEAEGAQGVGRGGRRSVARLDLLRLQHNQEAKGGA